MNDYFKKLAATQAQFDAIASGDIIALIRTGKRMIPEGEFVIHEATSDGAARYASINVQSVAHVKVSDLTIEQMRAAGFSRQQEDATITTMTDACLDDIGCLISLDQLRGSNGEQSVDRTRTAFLKHLQDEGAQIGTESIVSVVAFDNARTIDKSEATQIIQATEKRILREQAQQHVVEQGLI